MNFLLDNWILVFAALTSGAMLLWPLVTASGGTMTPAEAVRLINRERAVLIDVSEPAAYAAGHAANARNIPFGDLEKLAGLPKNKTLPLVLMCPNGARAVKAAGSLRQLGFQNVHALTGGLAAWRDANLPVERSA